MADPTLADLAARVARIETTLGLGPITPDPTPAPTPAPAPDPVPTPQVPAAPVGLRNTTLPDKREQLDWDTAPAAEAVINWDVADRLNKDNPIKETVTTPRSIRSAIKPGTQRSYVIRARNAAGVSPWSAPLDLPVAAAPPAGGVPGDLLDLRYWYLTLPTGAAGSPDTVHMPQLANYSSKYFELTPAGDGVVCRVWHGGVTTSGSSNPRSELRECNPDGTHASWAPTAGRHSMEVVGQVNRLTKVRPYVVIGQIHSATEDVTVFRIEANKLWITAGDTPHGYLLDDQFTLGKPYSIAFDVTGGIVSYRYNGQPVPYTLKAAGQGMYFKAGAYLQSNPTTAPTESTTEYAEVVIRSVQVTHA